MILPTKHIKPDRALIGVGAEILQLLRGPMTVSGLWDEVRERRSSHAPSSPISYQWFILALDFLYMIDAISFKNGLLQRRIER